MKKTSTTGGFFIPEKFTNEFEVANTKDLTGLS
jgi:hypothetical protein